MDDKLSASEATAIVGKIPPRRYLPPDREEGEGEVSAVDLMGDWSWRPGSQVEDPGYEFDQSEMDLVNEALELSDAFGTPRNKGMHFALALVPPRPWLVPAHVGLAERPARLNCIR